MPALEESATDDERGSVNDEVVPMDEAGGVAEELVRDALLAPDDDGTTPLSVGPASWAVLLLPDVAGVQPAQRSQPNHHKPWDPRCWRMGGSLFVVCPPPRRVSWGLWGPARIHEPGGQSPSTTGACSVATSSRAPARPPAPTARTSRTPDALSTSCTMYSRAKSRADRLGPGTSGTGAPA